MQLGRCIISQQQHTVRSAFCLQRVAKAPMLKDDLGTQPTSANRKIASPVMHAWPSAPIAAQQHLQCIALSITSDPAPVLRLIIVDALICLIRPQILYQALQRISCNYILLSSLIAQIPAHLSPFGWTPTCVLNQHKLRCLW